MKKLEKMRRDEMILEIIKQKHCLNYFYGYDSLSEEIYYRFKDKISPKELKFRLRAMRVIGQVEVRPTFSDGTGLLNGSAYFYKEPKMGTFDGQVFPIGSKLTSKENGELTIAPEGTPDELIVGIVK